MVARTWTTLGFVVDRPARGRCALQPRSSLVSVDVYDAHVDFVWRLLLRLGVPD